MAGSRAVPAAGTVWNGRVQAVFGRSVHVALNAPGPGCLTLGGVSLPAHPYSILWPDFPQDWTVGQPITVTAQGVFGAAGELVGLTGLPRYTPSLAWRPMAENARITQALAASRDKAAAIPSRGGFHEVFLQCHCPGPAPSDMAGRLSRSFASLGRQLCTQLSRCLSRRQWEGVARIAGLLAGLGLGLTPAGDDFLAGVLTALRYHGHSRGHPLLAQTELCALARQLAGQTTDFSGFLLRAAADGLVAAPVDDWLAAVHAGNPAQAANAVSALAKLGHSSGLDTFSGLLLTLQILLGERPWTHA
ncbi:DUF2877 domain-containing protein [Solidesulfovibrio sp.]|uniref:oxamate carbamoyltransferase subunit AllH family protein n=1 Tax=Solidesulfovibrio sp. TaxID=2910990 RepID=UPI002B1EEA20|nr:DUF2877 domain-containing protein [Solidesulfovibrio sp.]MEA4857131.1 DUF2877 domain-containing protein [Solidesulfovibrio sp.]